MSDLQSQVLAAFQSMLGRGEWTIDRTTEAAVFDNAAVTLRHDNLLCRIVRERGLLSAQFASATHSDMWFDGTIVAELIEGAPEDSFMDMTGALILDRFARFVNAYTADLARLFAVENYDATCRELERLERESVRRRFGV
ncbi:MAG: hypothetical protein P8174_11470 [Gemmatimonadota bacterium]|jgi:hypothetical protein